MDCLRKKQILMHINFVRIECNNKYYRQLPCGRLRVDVLVDVSIINIVSIVNGQFVRPVNLISPVPFAVICCKNLQLPREVEINLNC